MSAKQEFIRGIGGILPSHKGCVATIGSFDGVHRGHKAILARLREVGQSMNLPSLVIVFEPQPFEFFSKQKAPARLMRLREKVAALLALGIDRVLCLKFDQNLRGLSAAAFVEQILVAKLGVAHLEIGDDFRFGCDRAGDFALLKRMGEQHGFSVCDTKTHIAGDTRISSTRVRQMLEVNDLEHARQLLGERFSIAGRVVYGRQLGRSINVPTANVGLGRFRSPVQGVYAVQVNLLNQGGQAYQGVANVGVKPTVHGAQKPLLEVHLFGFTGDLYGQCIRVVFFHKLRSEQKFASVDELKAQIYADIESAKNYFKQQGAQA